MIMTTQNLVRSPEFEHLLPPDFMRLCRRLALESLRR